jgi:hypothetical protein
MEENFTKLILDSHFAPSFIPMAVLRPSIDKLPLCIGWMWWDSVAMIAS